MKRKEKIGIFIAAILTAWLLQHIMNALGIPNPFTVLLEWIFGKRA